MRNTWSWSVSRESEKSEFPTAEIMGRLVRMAELWDRLERRMEIAPMNKRIGIFSFDIMHKRFPIGELITLD